MHSTTRRLLAGALSALALGGCASSGAHVAPAATVRPLGTTRPRSPVAEARQLVLVTTPAWDSTSGTLRRFERGDANAPWREVGATVAIVVGQTGLAWDDALHPPAGEPVKREGDGRSPAGAFALDTAFGFSDAASASWIALPYLPLRETTECVDDVASVHYNTIVDRASTPTVDWTSAEHMRRIGQYKLGVHVAYNAAPPRRGRGSCIFLHIWAGPSSVTSGCTAMDAAALESLVRWMNPTRRPMLVQLPAAELQRLREEWGLP